ncbi:MAG: formyltetrahydrofolate deformylase [Patescibacteria group bacterium]
MDHYSASLSNAQVLLISCRDRKGLISHISRVLYENDLNIISNREFVDSEKNRFYMRTEFTGIIRDKRSFLKGIKENLPSDANVKLPDNKKKKVVVLATKEHHCLAELLIRNFYSDLNINIQAVISNHNKLEDFVNKFHIPYHFLSHEGKTKKEHEQEINRILTGYEFDYLILAKYMRILSPEFVQDLAEKIINIHHSFLPAFAGANPYHQAYQRGVKIIGATAHFVTSELDQGPIIVQDTKNIDHTYEVNDIKRAGRDMETLTLMKAIQLVTEDRVFVNGNKTIIFS